MKAVSRNTRGSLKNNRKIKIFLFFLILTTILWLLVELSKSYTTTAKFRVSYVNVPTEKLLQSEAQQEIEIVFRAPGFSILKYKLSKHKLDVDLTYVNSIDNRHYLLANSQISGMNSQLSGDINLIEVVQDSLFITLGENLFKKVPVIPNLDISFKLGYNYTDRLEIKPDSIVISGPDFYIDTISSVKSDYLKLDEVSADIDETLLLLKMQNLTDVVYEMDKIKIQAAVDRFTEGQFVMPVVIINEPEYIKINPFPKEIEVIFQAGLSNFNKIDESSFSIVYDYKQYEKDTLLQYLTPVIRYQSEYISSLKINPPQIEFLIQK